MALLVRDSLKHAQGAAQAGANGIDLIAENPKNTKNSKHLHLRGLCTANLQFARGLRGFLTQQKPKADRIMAGQNYAESNTGAPILYDSVRP